MWDACLYKNARSTWDGQCLFDRLHGGGLGIIRERPTALFILDPRSTVFWQDASEFWKHCKIFSFKEHECLELSQSMYCKYCYQSVRQRQRILLIVFLDFLFSKMNFPRNRSGQIPTMEAAGSSDRKVSGGCSTAPAPRQWHESFEISGGKIWQMVPQIFIWCTWTNIVNFWWNHKQLSGWLSFIILALNACFKLIKLVLIVTNCNCTLVHFHDRPVVFDLLSAIPRPIMNLIEKWTRIHRNIARNTNTNNKRNIVTQSWPWASPRPIIDQIAPSYHPPILVTPC